jgi:hypothetical protein
LPPQHSLWVFENLPLERTAQVGWAVCNLRQSRIVCRANDAVLQVQDDDDELTMVNGPNDTATDHRIHPAVGNHFVSDAGFAYREQIAIKEGRGNTAENAVPATPDE